MKQTVAKFVITKTQYIDPGGNLAGGTPEIWRTEDGMAQLLEWYKMMTLGRVFDSKAINLQKQGRMGTYASSEGQEAIGVGVASAMTDDDVLIPTYRDQVAQMMRAGTPEEAMMRVMLAWGGDERGHKREGRNSQDWPMCIPIATQAAHAVGVAMAKKIQKRKGAVVCLMGDGATSKGDIHEAMTFASVWSLPIVFVIENNQYAISQPRKLQSGAQTLAQIGIGAGITWCKQVDGNDVIAVYEATREALERAWSNQGPTVIEAETYRLGSHTTADDAGRYRKKEEVEEARRSDPIIRVGLLLVRRGVLGAEVQAALSQECHTSVENAAKKYRDMIENHPQTVDDIFTYLHATLPSAIKEQMELARSFEKEKNGGGTNGS